MMAIIFIGQMGREAEMGCELPFGSLERPEQALKQQNFWNVLSYAALPSPVRLVHDQRRTDYRITPKPVATLFYPRFVGLSNQNLTDAESNNHGVSPPPKCSAYRSGIHGNALNIYPPAT